MLSDSMGLNLARGEIFTTSIGSVDLLYTGWILVCKSCNILSKLKALNRDYLQYWYVVLKNQALTYIYDQAFISIHVKSFDIHICCSGIDSSYAFYINCMK